MSELMEATGLCKSYGRTTLLSGVDLRAKGGELVLIQGVNGVGKTTLLRLLAGREKPDAGEVYINGRSLGWDKGGLTLSRDRLPFLIVRSPQSPRTFSSLTVAECFRLVSNNQGGLFRAGFEDYLDRTAGSLSGGRRKALSIALALETGAPVILLDEPEAGLDPSNVRKLADMISTAKAAGRSLVVCAHQPSQEIKSLANQSYWLYDGGLNVSPRSLPQRHIGSNSIRPAITVDDISCSPASLLVSGMRIRRNGMNVLDNISFELRPGQVLSISGPNGSGKSSLALSLLGLIQAEGQVELNGTRVDQLPTHRRVELGMSFMPQSPLGLFYDLTVEENLRSAVRPRARTVHSLEWSWEAFPELKALKAQPARRLSGGLQRLLTLAMSLQQNPRLLILDEPLAGLAGGENGLATRVTELLSTLIGCTTALIFEHRSEEIRAAGFQHIGLSDLSRNKKR